MARQPKPVEEPEGENIQEPHGTNPPPFATKPTPEHLSRLVNHDYTGERRPTRQPPRNPVDVQRGIVVGQQHNTQALLTV